jgi:hypothetical protein
MTEADITASRMRLRTRREELTEQLNLVKEQERQEERVRVSDARSSMCTIVSWIYVTNSKLNVISKRAEGELRDQICEISDMFHAVTGHILEFRRELSMNEDMQTTADYAEVCLATDSIRIFAKGVSEYMKNVDEWIKDRNNGIEVKPAFSPKGTRMSFFNFDL